jgi:AAA ATPase domain
MLRLAVPMFLVAYTFTLVGEAILRPFALLKYTDITSLLLMPMVWAVVGIAFGIALGIAFVADGIALGIALGIAFGIAFGIAGGMTFSITFGVAGSIVAFMAVGIAFGIAGGMTFSIAFGIVLIALGMASGIVLKIEGGGITLDIVSGIAFGIGAFLGLYRVPLYVISAPSTLYAYIASRKQPHAILGRIRRSSLHWDERVYLPLPFLKQMLLLAYEEDPHAALTEFAFIAAERPPQLRATRKATIEILMRDLESRKTLQHIAGIAQRLNEILPTGTNLSDPRWTTTLPKLSDTSREAMRCLQPIGRQARLESLDRMIENLNRIRPNVAFRNQQLNMRLKQVIMTWLDIAEVEYKRIENAGQDIGNIDNPYRPGQILGLHDPLFVGRRDLAQQLEQVLNKGNRRPTLLLQGERRMGKTSTLQQLPDLLGASYIPVIYNMQDPKLYARITTLLGTLAGSIHDQLLSRGIAIDGIPFARLQGARDIKDPMAYSIFDRWFKRVEATLEKEDRSLLLAFDEFEKFDEAAESEYLDLKLFLDWCRQIIQYHPHIILLFSGVHAFSDMGTKTGLNWSNYFVNVQTLKVSFLNSDEARRLVIHPRPDFQGEEIFGGVVEQILLQTNHHPFLIQALCSQLVDDLNIEKGQRVELAHVTRAIEQMIDSWDGYFDDLWKRCDEPQRACLLVLYTQEWASPKDILQQYSHLDEQRIHKALRTLVRRDLVVRKDDTTYRIATPIFNRWVKDNS